ncbi:MAG: hypothetical protein J1F23_02680 [Oscillospiraceae bacterium]|nr:hypothetical protein [Oscillospiraceae bacterium]
MKYFSVLLLILFIFSVFSACKKQGEIYVDPETDLTSSINETEDSLTAFDTESFWSESSETNTENAIGHTAAHTETQTETTSNKIDETTTLPKNNNSQFGDLGDLEDSEVVTYYCDDVNNRYIVAVAEKYGVEKSTLIAMIRTKAKNPGATVLQFSGKTDNNGNMLMTGDELKAVYEVSDTDGSIKKATGKLTGNDGYNYIESVGVFQLTKEFIVPSLDEMKRERPYNGQ